jgi:precorrin-6Y C5,15-methyltransferase (decarboxylating)
VVAVSFYVRVLREESRLPLEKQVYYADSVADSVAKLEGTQGNVLVTTGSKELAAYTALKDYRQRIYARVLSLPQVVQSCSELGIEGKHLICMQGPFSREMNCALIRQVNASWMVTKESGKNGGFLEKYQAALECGCKLMVIGRPLKEEGLSPEQVIKKLEEKYSLPQKEEKTDLEQVRSVSLVGIGMGNPDTLTIEGKQALNQAQLLVGAGRMLESMKKEGQECLVSYSPEEICTYILEHPQSTRVAIAYSGDVGFYSGARKMLEVLHKRLPQAKIRLYTGISSMIYFCGKLETSWEDVFPVSLHGRQRNILGLLREHPRIFAIVGGKDQIAELAQKLVFYGNEKYGIGKVKISIGQWLSYPQEKILTGYAEEFTDYQSDPLSVVLLEREDGSLPVVTHGIPDKDFCRDKVPMTKEEVRSVSLSKLQLKKDSVIYDIGAGTGSVSVEMALQAVEGRVYAIEKKAQAVELIEKNKKKFGADNLEILQGTAPQDCMELPRPTHAFIGGSSGNMKAILELLLQKNPGIRVVVNCITLETLSETMDCIRTLAVGQVDIAQIGVAKGKQAGPYHLMMGSNPVYVISFEGQETENESE